MHIVHLLPELKQGGVETVVLGLNRELIKAGHLCTVISSGGKLTAQIEADEGKHIELNVCSKNPLTIPVRTQRLRSVLSELNPDILHVHSRVPAWLAWLANKKLKCPLVTTVHGFNSVSKYSEIMTKGDRVICVSNPVKSYIQQNYRVSNSRIRVIHPGIEPDAFSSQNVDETDIDTFKTALGMKEKRIVSSVGRITELKDYETFIRAIAEASKNDPDLRGLIIGHVRHDKEDYYNRLLSLIHELKLKGIVHIVTNQTDIPIVYAASDLIVSCSKKPESFGLTLIEALAMNTPVAATRHGGPLDIIQENDNGYFFNIGNSNELAEILLKPAQLKKTEFREDTIQRFSLTSMMDKTINIYSELC